jgi:tRNA-specific 2-thiouridylase
MKKIAIAMSGGVDSGAAAALVIRAGYKAAGFHMHLWSEGFKDKGFENKCCSTESLEAARRTAHQLGIPFYTINFEKIFKKRVVDYFLKEYGLGRTPNPCVMCNRFIKFGELLGYAKKLGYDYLATGHYARVVQKGRFHLLMGKDKVKDQSYFLYNFTQRQLAQVMFPVGEYTKKEVIAMAKKWNLPVASRPESQEICFFPESDYRPFLKRQIPKKIVSGDVVDIKGKVIGRHKGIPLYTIGQRHGFTITDKKVIGPLYVVRKDFKKNQLVVGFGKEAENKHFWVKNVNWMDPNFESRVSNHELRCKVRIRHQGELLEAKVKSQKSKIKVELAEGERGVSPGQAAVFYQGGEVLGGGIIAIDKER